ncbi:CHAT domain-containing protein [Leptolyngbya sp. AN03gr2]|uniref:CHAT domain-containing tetratricopeptide repeat protein n=1 Tax=unclassified Leptolyngbya TaxID=2650499 RepID=UPI003D3194E2
MTNEQREQAYIQLIEQLLNCPQGQEEALLQANAELVNAGLLEMMRKYADWMESQGDRSVVRLRNFAGQVAQALYARGFLVEVVQLIAQTKGDRNQMYEFFRSNLARFDQALLSALPDVFQFLIQKKDKALIAWVFVEFGNLINQFPLGTRGLNLELGIAAYEQVLQVRTRNAFPEQWAIVQNNLANAYSKRIHGERADNFERAITAHEQALQVRTRNAFPEDWAITQHNLASAYSKRIRGERADNLEEAIIAYEQALQVRTRNAFPEDWAMTQNGLASAYSNRIRGERADNLEQAIIAYEQALQVFTRDAFPEDWAMTQNDLAVVYSKRIHGERADNLEQAIIVCEQALQVRTRNAFPEDWAMTQHNLALAYSKRIRGERADNLEQAIIAYEQALQVRTRNAFPEDWAVTQHNLAAVYRNRIRGERADNLEQAIIAYEQVLQVFTRNAFPRDWAMTQHNLANAYADRICGERADNLEQAIIAYEQALQVRTRNASPEDWAVTQHNLAFTYSKRICGERADNLEQAIIAYEQALQVRTRNASPEDWAMTQNNLALAYADRICGERADNLEQAITAYEQTLQIFTRNAFPNACRRTSRNLGDLHFQQQNWNAAKTAYSNALKAAEILYQSCILLESKAAELAETADLPRRTAYVLAQTGNLTQAVETLEQGRARGLSESLNRDRADLAQLQQRHPDLYSQYQTLTQSLRNLESTQREQTTSSDRQQPTPETTREAAIALRQQLDHLIQHIRQVPNYENFLTLPKFAEVHAATQPNRPLVYLISTSAGSLALLVTPDNIDAIWLNNFTDTELTDLLNNTWFAAYNQFQRDRQGWYDAIDHVTRQLWKPLMEPLIRHLQTHNVDQAVLIPTGYLSLLPLHAAWTEDATKPTGRRYALDDIHFTYTPNAKSLTAAQAIATRTPTDSILAIDNPTQNLKDSEREIKAAIASFHQRTVLRHNEATIKEVRSHLSEAEIVHFSCHGTANLADPLNSGLSMSDGLLTLRDILALNLSDRGGIRLAILSACGTGLTGIENADEAIGLPTGLLQAGVAGVIGSLWSVFGLSTMILLTRFYDLWRTDGLEPAIALNQAQRWMHSTTDGEKARYCGLITLNPSDRAYAHPFHWAAFSYLGI